jgi:hypothetical protein
MKHLSWQFKHLLQKKWICNLIFLRLLEKQLFEFGTYHDKATWTVYTLKSIYFEMKWEQDGEDLDNNSFLEYFIRIIHLELTKTLDTCSWTDFPFVHLNNSYVFIVFNCGNILYIIKKANAKGILYFLLTYRHVFV